MTSSEGGDPAEEAVGPIPALEVDAFVRSVAVNKGAPHILLLGAGASITSGVLSAEDCLWDWKRRIFVSNHPGSERHVADSTLPVVRERLQRWLDQTGRYPGQGAPGEYGFFAEACYPLAEDRRVYFQTLIADAKPYVGYRAIALLAKAGVLDGLWTTNFDALAVGPLRDVGMAVIEVDTQTTERLKRQTREGEFIHVALHGDYRYEALNTDNEVRRDAELRHALGATLPNGNLIVCGYSGRDDTVMTTLRDAYGGPGVGRLYWCGVDDEPPDTVAALLSHARKVGREVFYVRTNGVDDTFARLALQCVVGDLASRAQQLHAELIAGNAITAADFTAPTVRAGALAKTNLFAIECPGEVLQFEADLGQGPGVWKRIRDWVGEAKIAAVPSRGSVYALGLADDVQAAFSGRIKGPLQRTPVVGQDLARDDGAIVSLLLDALCKALVDGRSDLSFDRRDTIWEVDRAQTVRVASDEYSVHDAVTLALRRYAGQQYLVLQPTIRAAAADGAEAPEEAAREIRRQVLTKQYNQQFDAAVTKWRDLLLRASRTVEFPSNSGSGFRFTVAAVPSLSLAATANGRPQAAPGQLSRYVRFQGTEREEPMLVFSARAADRLVVDRHPIRGLVSNRPFDHVLTVQGWADDIKVGVIATRAEAAAISRNLSKLHQSIVPDSKQEYLVDYPGFAQAFGVGLRLPAPDGDGWITCAEPDAMASSREGGQKLRHELVAGIEQLVASGFRGPIVVYVPSRWARWERYEVEGEHFDLHDFIKAYCVKRGIATQFVREATFAKAYDCEIVWWLALALYVKSMRTPWILETLDDSVAFMGLGFSIDRSGATGHHVVVGCSHIFSADGRGLRYRLSKLENPVIRGKNPFMSQEDARRLAEHGRQLMFESHGRMPRRVVIHKRTPFLPTEIAGLREGLAGVEEVEMLQVTEEPVLRGVACRITDGLPQAELFPIRRGTAVALDRRRMLLWAHGTADAVQPGRRYYQGKSRVPAPLVVTRFAGTSEMGRVADEVLALSKMDWNTFDLYSSMPATLKSSNRIARIGSLLDRFGPASYDYRLFM